MPLSLDSRPAPSLTDGGDQDPATIVNNYVANLQKKQGKKDFSNEAFSFPRSRSRQILLSQLPTTKLARKFETLLGNYLHSFGTFIEQNPEVARRSYSAFMRDVEDTIRSINWNTYWLGIQYAAKFDGVKPFPTDRDLSNVRELTQSITAAINRRVTAYLDRVKEIDQLQQLKEIAKAAKLTAEQSGVKKIPNPLRLSLQLQGLATVATTAALNIGTIDKARQLSEGSAAIVNPLVVNGTISEVKYASGAISAKAQAIIRRERRIAAERAKVRRQIDLQNTIYNDIVAGLALLTLIPDQRWKGPTSIREIDRRFESLSGRADHLVMWKTHEDDLVCTQFCEPLEGQVFNMEDPDTPIPIRDTHTNCRCRYIFLDEEDQMFLF
jgi:hypothetical protein